MSKSMHGVRCYESHPALPVGEFLIYGGSCAYPVVKDADVYVGLDYSHATSPKAYPWEQGDSFLFHIQDMHAPSDPKQFKNLIDWICVQLISQRKVHVGCIGGHGRTGTVLAAVVRQMTGEKDAITYVREHYCSKAVESTSQVGFLEKHYGILRVTGAKELSSRAQITVPSVGQYAGSKSVPKKSPVTVEPMRQKTSMWAQRVLFDKPEKSGIIKV